MSVLVHSLGCRAPTLARLRDREQAPALRYVQLRQSAVRHTAVFSCAQFSAGSARVTVRLESRRAATRARRLVVSARRGEEPSVDVASRVIAAVPYLLPLLDGLRYSKVRTRCWSPASPPLTPLWQFFFLEVRTLASRGDVGSAV